jgi:replicative DNA helicase
MEKGVLSSMMAGGPATIAECAEKITAGHFFVTAHRTFFDVLVKMWSAEKPIDLISFTEDYATATCSTAWAVQEL